MTSTSETSSTKTTKRTAVKRKATDSKKGPPLKVKKEENLDTQDEEDSFQSSFNNQVVCEDWTVKDYLIEQCKLNDDKVAENIIKLFKEDNTIPFIARYRKNMTGGLEAEQLRVIKESLDQADAIKHKATNIIKTIDKAGKWTPELHSIVMKTKNLSDLEHIYSLYKPATKRSLAERAKQLGLEPFALDILAGKKFPNLQNLVDVTKEGLRDEKEISEGLKHIIADVISKDKETFEKIKELRRKRGAFVQSKLAGAKKSEKKNEEGKKKDEEQKYDFYYDFNASEDFIKPHQILAINRGEAQKVLSVTVMLPSTFDGQLENFCMWKYRFAMRKSESHRTLIQDSYNDSYKRLIKPLIVRKIRSELKENAEKASIEVFAKNLKQLLLTPPVRGKIVLGVDPGFSHGCKLAVVSEQGAVLDTLIIYPHTKKYNSKSEAGEALTQLVKKHQVSVIALGNATACRETEVLISELIKSRAFKPLDVSYTIIDEAGTSIYSCSKLAKEEFPNLNCNVISAISIARRLQDPLAELVKVEPKHLGVGMYQHDIPEKHLIQSLNEVVTEAVSFVGVDINTASLSLLQRVAGLTTSVAQRILACREKTGTFENREQLKKIKGIGAKTFEQCAGFIRILPETVSQKERELNYLDQTWIHPESYGTAKSLLKKCRVNIADLGTDKFIDKINEYASKGVSVLAKELNSNETTVEIIVRSLSMRRNVDIRSERNVPLFLKGIQKIDDLKLGSFLNGQVRNVTLFGVFVDVGVGVNGLIHNKFLNNQVLNVGDRVEVKVLWIEKQRNRIGLCLNKIL